MWVICLECSRWNLTPFEERWEAIEECAHLFEHAPIRGGLGAIALARCSTELELVRVGASSTRELSGWRYGDSLGTHFRKHWKGVERARRRRVLQHRIALTAACAALGAAGYAVAPLGVTLAAVPLGRAYIIERRRHASRVIGQAIDTDGWAVPIRAGDLGRTRVSGTNAGIAVGLTVGASEIALDGDDAVWALGLWLPWLNRRGVHRSSLLEAARIVEYTGSAEAFFARIAASHRLGRKPDPPLGRWPGVLRMALEMAADGCIDAAASAGELRRLERAWKEAEEIAKIADQLIPSPNVDAALVRMKHPERGR